MADSTHKAVVLKEKEERLAARLDARVAELAGSLQHTLASLKDILQEHVTQSSFNESHPSHEKKFIKFAPYSAGIRFPRIEFPRFNGEM